MVPVTYRLDTSTTFAPGRCGRSGRSAARRASAPGAGRSSPGPRTLAGSGPREGRGHRVKDLTRPQAPLARALPQGALRAGLSCFPSLGWPAYNIARPGWCEAEAAGAASARLVAWSPEAGMSFGRDLRGLREAAGLSRPELS